MAARSLNRAVISFGLVTVPVKVYPAANPSGRIRFHLLHARDHRRLKQQYVCTKDGAVVPRSEMVKGYEYAKDHYVVFTPEELKKLEQDPTHGIEIAEFVPEERVDPVYFERPYYLGPEKGAEKSYALLVTAMTEEGYAALATYASHGKDHLVLLRPAGPVLAMHQLFYSEDVRGADEIAVPAKKSTAAELKLARQLMQSIAHDRFDPSRYEDDVRARLRETIARKRKGQPIVARKPEREAKIVDLMEALKASLGLKGATRSGGRRTAARAARRTARAKAPTRRAG
jgi:DNA end-binding protein Ku